MKEKIFNKMKEYGWTLESFNDTFNYHCENIDDWCDLMFTNDNYVMQDIDKQDFDDTVKFMSDFLRAINDVDKVNKEMI